MKEKAFELAAEYGYDTRDRAVRAAIEYIAEACAYDFDTFVIYLSDAEDEVERIIGEFRKKTAGVGA